MTKWKESITLCLIKIEAMEELRYTLISDGSSDKTLTSIINWTLNVNYPTIPIKGQWADLRGFDVKTISEKIKVAEELYPFDILFYHRDAESTNVDIIQQRKEEIRSGINNNSIFQKTVCVVPIKMMESWLLFDEAAIKKAAGNRNYRQSINLPALKKIEQISQPKDTLHQALKSACGLTGRRLDKFNCNKAVHLLADYITDFSPLRSLRAFQEFEQDIKSVVDNMFIA